MASFVDFWHRRRWALLAVAGTLALGAVLVVVIGLWRPDEPSRVLFPLRGLDISHHQGTIDWDELARTGVDFIYVKASEGENHRDTQFARNWTEAQRTGVPAGAYHFFSFHIPGRRQAANFLATVPSTGQDLPPAVDVEFDGQKTPLPPLTNVRRELAILLDELERATRRRPVIYTNRDGFQNVIAGQFGDHPLWFRDDAGPPVLPGGWNWVVWQFTGRGGRRGIKGEVDLDVFSGDRVGFQNWCAERIVPPPLPAPPPAPPVPKKAQAGGAGKAHQPVPFAKVVGRAHHRTLSSGGGVASRGRR